MTKFEFAEKIGVSSNTVHRWEKGKHVANMRWLMKIAKLFDVSLSWLSNGTEPKSNAVKVDVAAIDVLPKKDPAECDYNKEHFFALFSTLSVTRQGRLLGYLDAMCREELLSINSIAE